MQHCINALEGGMQQLLNLALAFVAFRYFGFGRKVTEVKIKLISVATISVGIFLSTLGSGVNEAAEATSIFADAIASELD